MNPRRAPCVHVAIFTPADNLAGGNYRMFRILEEYPRGKYALMMPGDAIERLRRDFGGVRVGRRTLSEILDEAIALRPLGRASALGYVRYAKYAAREAARAGADLLYFPHEHAYMPLGFRLSGVRWTELLQLTPVVFSLPLDEGSGLRLFLRNMEARGYGPSKSLKGYARLKLMEAALRGMRLLAVSRSIPYELERLGIDLDVAALDPGVGVDPCPGRDPGERDVDVAFFSRVVREKGIFDFLVAFALLRRRVPGARGLVIGFASSEAEEAVRAEAGRLGILDSLEFAFNAPRRYVHAILSRARLLLYPSLADAFPLSLLESLSCGVPAVAYDIPAIRLNYNTPAVERVRPLDRAGMALRAAEILEEGRWEEMGRAGAEFSGRFTWEAARGAEWDALRRIADADDSRGDRLHPFRPAAPSSPS